MKRDRQSILFVCTEDWFFNSHFLPLSETVQSIQDCDGAVLCGAGEARELLEKAGLRVLPIDFSRSKLAFLPNLRLLWELVTIFRRENPDLVHFIALKPILLGGLASLAVPRAACVYHLTGLGFITVSMEQRDRRIRKIFLTLILWLLKRRKSWLVLENIDDREALNRYGSLPERRLSILGGAGVDPDFFMQLSPPQNLVLHAAFVGRMVWSKGIDVLVDAIDELTRRGLKIRLDLYGVPDNNNPRAVSAVRLEEWNDREDVGWHGRIEDVREVWQLADIAIVPSRGGEGLPRSLLEAAACGRPLIVTDVPGCRDFVRDGVEGFVIQPEDPYALADAMEKLINDPDLRLQMGKAARQRLLDGYTEQHVRSKMLEIYQTLLG